MTKLSDILHAISKKLPIVFEDLNFKIIGISCLNIKDLGIYDNSQLNANDIARSSIAEFQLGVCDNKKPYFSSKCIYDRLNKTLIPMIEKEFKSSGMEVSLYLDDGDYPIDLKSDYRGDTTSLYVKMVPNYTDEEISKIESNIVKIIKTEINKHMPMKVGQRTIVKLSKEVDVSIDNISFVITNNSDEIKTNYSGIFNQLIAFIGDIIRSKQLNKLYQFGISDNGYLEEYNEISISMDVSFKQ